MITSWLFTSSLCQSGTLIFLCHYYECTHIPIKLIWEPNIWFSPGELIHTACSVTDFHLTWIVGSSKTEMNSLHPLAKSTLVLLPLWRPALLSSALLLGSRKGVEWPVNQRWQFLTWNHTSQVTHRDLWLSGFVWSQRSCGRMVIDTALDIEFRCQLYCLKPLFMLHLHKELLHCWVTALVVISVSHQHPACVSTCWTVQVMVFFAR